MRAVLLATIAALVVVGCAAGGKASTSAPRVSAAACAAPLAAGRQAVAFTSGGARRSAVLDVPAARRGIRVPLIVALHFAGGTGREMADYTRLSTPAARAGFAVAYPTTSHGDGVWRLRADADGRADVRLVADLLGAVDRAICVDSGHTFATGVSNGAGMAAKLACALPGRFGAVAPVAPGLRAIAACPTGPKVAILEIHGRADTVVPYAGRGPGHAGAVRPWLRRWAARDGCRPTTTVTNGGHGIVRERWNGCAVPVGHILLTGTDHGWPGASGRFPRHDPTGLEANREVLAFFVDALQDS